MVYAEVKELVEKRGGAIGPLLPANWISLSGDFTTEELEALVVAVKENYAKINGK